MYSCQIDELSANETSELKTVTGEHKPGMSNENVTSLFINDAKLSRLPKKIDIFFPNLQSLDVIRSGLKKITRDDISVFKNLQRLSLNSNALTTLDSDVFESNLDLLVIDVSGNKDTKILKNVFKPLNACKTEKIEILKLKKEVSDFKEKDAETIKISSRIFDECEENKIEIRELTKTNKKHAGKVTTQEEQLKQMRSKMNDVGMLTESNLKLTGDVQKLKTQLKLFKLRSNQATENLKVIEKKLTKKDELELFSTDLDKCAAKLKSLMSQSTKIDLICAISDGSCNVQDLRVSDSETSIERVVEKDRKPVGRDHITKIVILNQHATIYLPFNFAAVFSKLNELRVVNSGLVMVEKSVFTGLKLKTLDLSHNKLTAIEGKTFSELSKLLVLDLSSNHIEVLEVGAFNGLNGLETLNLNENLLVKLTSESLSHLKGLKFLFISNNKLKLIAANLIPNAGIIVTVDFTDNICIDLMARGTEYSNFKKEIASNCAEPLYIQCDFENKQGLYFCTVKDLVLGIPNVRVEKVKNDHLPGKSNNDVRFLMIIKQMMEFFPLDFGELFPNIENLVVDSTELKQIGSKDFTGMTNLKMMIIRMHKIETIERGAFDGCKNLEKLYMRFNEIESLPDGVFESLSKLKLINLSDNKLKVLKKNFFPVNNQLEEILFQNNRLQKIDATMFHLMTRSKILLSGNVCTHENYDNLKNNDDSKFWPFFGKVSTACS